MRHVIGWTLAAVAGLAVTGCDKLDKLTGSTAPAAAKADAPPAGLTEAADPALARLVKRTPQGVVMRRDLPLPSALRVDWEAWDDMPEARKFRYGLSLGRPAEVTALRMPNQTFFAKLSIQRHAPDQYTLTVPPLPASTEPAPPEPPAPAPAKKPKTDKQPSQAALSERAARQGPGDPTKLPEASKQSKAAKQPKPDAQPNKPEKKADKKSDKKEIPGPPPAQVLVGSALSGATVTMTGGTGHWAMQRADGPLDFKIASWSQNLAADFDSLLRTTGVLTSPRWLGDTPLTPGQEIVLNGPDLAMVLGTPATGSLRLRFLGEKNVGRHPCAAFSVIGSYRAQPTLHWHGAYQSEDMQVDSGTAYLSLIYPLVPRLELDGVVSLSVWPGRQATGQPEVLVQGKTRRVVMAVPVFPDGWSPPVDSGAGD